MSRIDAIEGKIVSLWEDMVEARGFDRVVGTVLCTLTIEGKPLSQQEIAEKTGYSVPTISKTLKTLTPFGSIRKTKKPGTRTTFYSVDMHPLEMLSGTLTKWIASTKTMAGRMSEISKELERNKGENPEKAEKLRMILHSIITSIPQMIEIMEKAIEDVRKLGFKP